MKTKYEIVCELTAAGKSAKEIAKETGIDINTIYNYRTIINNTNKKTTIAVEKGITRTELFVRPVSTELENFM